MSGHLPSCVHSPSLAIPTEEDDRSTSGHLGANSTKLVPLGRIPVEFCGSDMGGSMYGAINGNAKATQRYPRVERSGASDGYGSGWKVAPQLGSMLAGLSILVENKKRRGEMALYVATRALCATVDEILPRWLRRRIIANRWVSIWVERICFSVSFGIITCAIVHHPDYVRGIVQGILKYAIGPDWPKESFQPMPMPLPKSTKTDTAHLASSKQQPAKTSQLINSSNHSCW
ncbi:hypothetical protein KEM48_008469 [Puccinia striiformis f. sp. tritici PST-130]|nr:hypothetical protein KEM48_008469 [Puccinia striiformis f. sp. tritici PST-130]